MGFMTAKAMESEAVFLWIELLTKGEVDANNASESLTQTSETFLLLVHYTVKLWANSISCSLSGFVKVLAKP